MGRFHWTVLALALAAPRAFAGFDSAPVTTAYVGRPYVYDVRASGRGRVDITAPNGLPPWLTLTPTGDGTARLSGTPGPGDTDGHVELLEQDSTCRFFFLFCYQDQSFDITIVPNAPPVVVAPGLADQTAVEGAPFALDVSAAFSDPDGDALTFTAAGLPPGWSLAAGRLAATPSQSDAAGSPYAVTITADDGRGGRVSDRFTLTVRALARADLSIEKIEAAPNPALTGAAVTWTFTLANAGPDAANSAVLGVDFRGQAMQVDAGDCTPSTDARHFDCTLGPLAAGQSVAVTLKATAGEPGNVYVAARVAAAADGPLDANAADAAAAASLGVGGAVSSVPAQALGGTAGQAVAAGDLDGDGFADAAIATGAGSPTELRLDVAGPAEIASALAPAADRRGLSAVPLSLDAGGRGLTLADLDNDGDLDIALAGGAAGTNAAFTNAGNGAMQPGPVLPGGGGQAVAAGDFDGDGFADLVFANRGANEVLLNRGGTGFAAAPALDGPALDSRGVALLDADGDGRLDLVFANADGAAQLYLNRGGGAFAPAAALVTGPTTAVASADFNGDGFPDLVFARTAPGTADGVPSDLVWLGDGHGGFSQGAALGAAPTVAVLAGDVNGDGAADIVTIGATGVDEVFKGDGTGAFALDPSLFTSPDPAGAAFAHLGAGKAPDLVVTGKHGTAVFFNDGQGHFGLGDTSPPVISLVGPADMTVQVDEPYHDPGAVATDNVDGKLTPTADGSVDTQLIGTYTVTYNAVDSAGNAAAPVSRTVHVEAKAPAGGGGGGGAGLLSLLALLGGAYPRTRLDAQSRHR